MIAHGQAPRLIIPLKLANNNNPARKYPALIIPAYIQNQARPLCDGRRQQTKTWGDKPFNAKAQRLKGFQETGYRIEVTCNRMNVGSGCF
jgi:hypothetical protein